MVTWLINVYIYFHGFPVGHKLNIKAKREKMITYNTQVSTLQPSKDSTTEQATFTVEEYNKTMSFLEKENGNNQSFVNMIGMIAHFYQSAQQTLPSEIYH